MTARHEPTEAMKAEVKALAMVGTRHDDIAKYMGIDKKTLYKYYREILDKGLINTNSRVAKSLVEMAMNGNVTAAIFWLKSQAGWKDREHADVEQEIKKLQLEKLQKELNPPKLDIPDGDYKVELKPDEDIPSEPIL